MSEVIVSDVLDSDHQSILFHIQDHVTTRNLSDLIEIFTDWERFQSLASELMSPRLQINSGVEADKSAREFIAPLASAYRLSTSNITVSDFNRDLPGLDRLLKHKEMLRKLWHKPGIQRVIRQLTGSQRPSDEWSGERHLNGGKQE
jgi:hypothetical protein